MSEDNPRYLSSGRAASDRVALRELVDRLKARQADADTKREAAKRELPKLP
jgi:hypothetical protein